MISFLAALTNQPWQTNIRVNDTTRTYKVLSVSWNWKRHTHLPCTAASLAKMAAKTLDNPSRCREQSIQRPLICLLHCRLLHAVFCAASSKSTSLIWTLHQFHFNDVTTAAFEFIGCNFFVWLFITIVIKLSIREQSRKLLWVPWLCVASGEVQWPEWNAMVPAADRYGHCESVPL